jgi:IMP dehydrogenase/GMP reductase
MIEKFITLAEAARTAGVPASRLNGLIESGKIVPAGRAGSSPNSAIIFRASDLILIQGALSGTASGMTSHKCANIAEIREKHAAFVRAASEGGE